MKKDISSVPASRPKMYRVLAILFTINMLVCVQCATAQGTIDSLRVTMSNDTVFVHSEYQSNVDNIIYFKCSPNGFNGPSTPSPYFLENPGAHQRDYVFAGMIPGKSYCVKALLTDTVGSSGVGPGQEITTDVECLPITTGLDAHENEEIHYVVYNGSIVAPVNTLIKVYNILGKKIRSGMSQLNTVGLKGAYLLVLSKDKNITTRKVIF